MSLAQIWAPGRLTTWKNTSLIFTTRGGAVWVEGNGGDDKLSGGPDVKDGVWFVRLTFIWHPCFGGKRPCFWGLTFKIEVIWVPGIYVYIYIELVSNNQSRILIVNMSKRAGGRLFCGFEKPGCNIGKTRVTFVDLRRQSPTHQAVGGPVVGWGGQHFPNPKTTDGMFEIEGSRYMI